MKKRLLAVFLALALCPGLLPVSALADEYTDTDAGWDIEDGVLYGYSGTERDLVIPDTVREINERAFNESAGVENGITSVVVPEGITSIPREAFWNCKSLTTVTLPSTITSIGFWAFRDCSSLTTINIPNGVTEIGYAAFSGCSSLTAITLPGSLSTINLSTFSDSGLTSIVIPEGITMIDEQAFENCKSLTTVTFPTYSLIRIERMAFYGCTSLTSITIPDSVYTIGDQTFLGCTGLTSATLNSHASVPDSMFYGCTGLTSLTIPEGVATIGRTAFYGCYDNLLNLVIPSTITTVGNSAFGGGKSNLVNVYYTGSRWNTISSGNWPLTNATLHNSAPCATHTYDAGVVDTPATCTTEGVKTLTCENCGWIDRQPIAKTAHTYDGGVETTPATCTDAGVMTFTCSNCDDARTEPIPMTGHDYGGWTETTPASCETDGVETRTCSHDTSHTETRSIAATGHDWGEWKDNGDGTHSQVCNRDSGHTQETGAHTYGDWTVTKAPTAREPGSKERTCDKCGHKDTEAIPATGGGTSVKPNFPANPNPPVNSNPPAAPDAPDDPTPDKPAFIDVPEKAFYADPVSWAVEKGITTGTSETTFSPDKSCTRKEIVTFLWRAAGSPEPETAVNPFTDVREGTYYSKAVLWALENGITTGTSDTTFAPDASCTRWQVVTFLWRAKGKPAAAAAEQFTDVASGAAYAQAVAWAADAGVATGTSATTFAPNSICNRGQIVTFLYRAYK